MPTFFVDDAFGLKSDVGGLSDGEYSQMQIDGSQVRAARAALRWTLADLAEAAEVGVSTIQEIEKAEPRQPVGDWRIAARQEALDKIRRAFEAAGVKFTAKGDVLSVAFSHPDVARTRTAT